MAIQIMPMDTAAAEGKLEAELRLIFQERRSELVPAGSMHWDASLSFLLMPLLAAYEQV